jgi:PAS domain S-box-containing protein
LTFRTKILLSVIAILLVFGVSLSFIISMYVSEALLQENRLRGVSIAINLSARAVEPILSVDFLELRNLVDESTRINRDVAYAFVMDREGDPLVHTIAGGFPVDLRFVNPVEDSEIYSSRLVSMGTERIDDFAAPVLIADDRIGTVRIGMSRSRVQEVVGRLLWTIFLSIGSGILIVGAVSAALARTVTSRIQALHRAANKAFCTFVGRDEKDVLGKTHEDLFPAGEAQENIREDREVLERKKTISLEKKIGRGNGERRLHVIKSAVLNADGEVSGILCTSRDITELKEFQERIIHSQRMETLGQIAAGVAHEINTPLGIILGYAQLCKEDVAKGTETFENLLIIEKYARICRTIVSDLLRFSRQMEGAKKLLDVSRILEQIASVVEHTFGLERVGVKRDFESRLPLVFGDQEKLEQAFFNLINNAYDAIGKDGEITLSTAYDKGNEEVVVRVRDTGKGIPPEIRDRIFDPFFTTKGVGKGTGLGLSVTFGIVKAHGGSIDFKSTCPERGDAVEHGEQSSRPEGGTTFTIRLPVSKDPGLESQDPV